MKKTLLAVALMSVSGSTFASINVYDENNQTIDVYGRVNVAAVNQEGSTQDIADSSDVRLGAKAKAGINENVSLIAGAEGEMKNSGFNARKIYGGLAFDNQTIVYGQTDGSLGMITDYTDILTQNSSKAAPKLYVADKPENNIAYVGNFNNLTVKANYVLESNESVDGYKYNVSGGSVGATYQVNNSSFGIGYAAQRNELTTLDLDNQQVFLGAGTTIDKLYLGALINFMEAEAGLFGIKGKTESTGYELAAKYTVSDKVALSGVYNYADVDNLDGNLSNITAQATYYFLPNAYVYGNAMFALGDVQKDTFTLGARYDF